MKKTLKLMRLILYVELIIVCVLQLNYSLDERVSFGYAVGLVGFIIIIFITCPVLITRIVTKLSFQESFLMLVILSIALFAYPLKQLWIYTDPSILEVFFFASVMSDLSPQAIGRYLLTEYSGYCMLMVGAWLSTLRTHLAPQKFIPRGRGLYRSKRLSILFAVIAFILMVILLFLMQWFGMHMGAGGVHLPFHMAGVILYSHLIIVPAITLMAIQLQPDRVSKRFIIVVSLILITYIAGDMVIRMSRSGLLIVTMLLLGLIAASRPEAIKRFIYLAIISVVGTIMLIPIVTSVRMAQIHDRWEFSYLKHQYEYYNDTVISFFAMRVTGAENVGLAMSNIHFDRLDVFEVLETGVVSYYTRDVLKVPENVRSAFSPSALGEVFILFGQNTGFIMIMILPWGLVFLNRLMMNLFRFVYPVTYAFLFIFAIKSVTGGIYAKDVYTLFGACMSMWLFDYYFMRIKAVRAAVATFPINKSPETLL